MKKILLFILIITAIVSCSNGNRFGKPNIDVNTIQQNVDDWKKYFKKNIEFSDDFTPVGIDDEKIEKSVFFQQLKTGKFIPVKLESEDVYYKLFPIAENTPEKIGKHIRSNASTAYQYYNMEGVKLPNFEFVDLDSVTYNNQNMIGKVMVIKCWFISCRICVEEFPELNKIVENYKSKEDVKFVSLAFDTPEKLEKFLEKKVFKYATVANQQNFMMKDLKVKRYPTHLIIDKEGKIYKMVDNVHALEKALEKAVKQ